MHNHRQGDDRTWAENLNQIRVADGPDLPDEVIDKLIERVTDDPMMDDGVIHAFYPNKQVNAHNAKMLSNASGEAIVFEADKVKMKGFKNYCIENGMIEGTGFFEYLTLKVGARVCLVTNLDQIDDLMNGQWGRVVGLETDPNKIAIVKFDDPNVGLMQQKAHPTLAQKYDGTPIFYFEMEFSLKCNPNLKGKIRQIPLRLSWASTIHKLQVTIQIKINKKAISNHISLLVGLYKFKRNKTGNSLAKYWRRTISKRNGLCGVEQMSTIRRC